MVKKESQDIIPIWEILLIIALFVLFSYFANTYTKTLRATFSESILSIVLYIVIFVLAVVIAPINSEPFIPVASQIWGWVLAGSLTLIGWTLGSVIAFLIARRYGASFLQKFIPLEKIQKFEQLIPQEHVFWSVVFLRMTIQVDLLSYVIGLFSKISVKQYFFATLIGLAPLAFLLAYLGELPLFYQLLAISMGLLLLLLGILIALHKKKEIEKSMQKSRSKKFAKSPTLL